MPELADAAGGEVSSEELPFLKHVVLMGETEDGEPVMGFGEFLAERRWCRRRCGDGRSARLPRT